MSRGVIAVVGFGEGSKSGWMHKWWRKMKSIVGAQSFDDPVLLIHRE